MESRDRRDVFEETSRIAIWGRLGPLGALVFVGAFIFLFVYFPTAWAILVATAFVVASGMFIATSFLKMPVAVRTLRVAIPIGLACLGLLFAIYKLSGSQASVV